MFLSHLAQPEADPDPGQLSAAAPRCCSKAAPSCFKAAPKLLQSCSQAAWKGDK